MAMLFACSNPKTAVDSDAYLEEAYQESLALLEDKVNQWIKSQV